MKELRKSGYGDYVAVDDVVNNKIISTPIYLKKNIPEFLKSKDIEEGKWFKTQVMFNGNNLDCMDVDEKSPNHGMTWTSELNELIDIFRPL